MALNPLGKNGTHQHLDECTQERVKHVTALEVTRLPLRQAEQPEMLEGLHIKQLQ